MLAWKNGVFGMSNAKNEDNTACQRNFSKKYVGD